MKIKKIRQKRSSSKKLLDRYRNSYKSLFAIEINSIKRVETNDSLAQQNSAKYCPVPYYRASVPSELYLKHNTLPENSSEQWQLRLSHGESNAIPPSSLTSVIQPEKKDINLYILGQSTKDNVDPFFSSKLEDLIQSTNLLALDCIESSIDQETYEKNVPQKDSHTPEPFSIVDRTYIPTILSDLDSVTSGIGEVDSFDECNSTTGSTFATESENSTTDAPFNESDLTKQVVFTQDADIDQISSPTQDDSIDKVSFPTQDAGTDQVSSPAQVTGINQTSSPVQGANPSEEVDTLDDCTQNHLFLSYEQVVPDDSDPDFYCRVCKTKSKDKASFYKHLTTNHKMILRPFSDWRVEDIATESHEEVPKSYCSKCDIAFSENSAYLEHFSDTMFHKFDAKGIDIYKSAFYQCDKCSLTRKGMFSFYRHYRKVHKLVLDITKYSPKQSLTNVKAYSTTIKPIQNLYRNSAIIKDNTSITECSTTKEGYLLEPANGTKTKRALAAKNNNRHSTRIQKAKAETKRRKSGTQKPMATGTSKRKRRATNPKCGRPPKINPRRVCQFCNKVLSAPAVCRDHIKRMHKAASTNESVELAPTLPEESVAEQNIIATDIIPDKPSKIDQFCNKVLSTPTACETHIEQTHKTPSTNESVEPTFTLPERRVSMRSRRAANVSFGKPPKIDPRRICQFCNKLLSSPAVCRNHIKRMHKPASNNESVESASTLPEESVAEQNIIATDIIPDKPSKIDQFCNKVLSTPTACETHIEQTHKTPSTNESVEPTFTLPERRVSMRSRKAANVSFGKPPKIDPRRICQFCNKLLSSPAVCRNHIKRMHKPASTSESVQSVSTLSEKNDRNIACVVCEKIHTSKELLYTHFKNTHKTETAGILCIADKLYCKLCDIDFTSSLDLEKHMRKSHHLIRDKKERPKCYCAVCNMEFKSIQGRNRHIVSKYHTENTLALKKTIAATSNDSQMSLEETSTEIEEEVSIPRNPIEHCNACNITFYNKSSSLMHFFKIHKFKYIEVPKKEVYKRKPNLNMLLKNQPLPKENDPNLYCNVCSKKFCNEGNFKLHLISIHEMVLKNDEPNPAESNASDKTESIGTDYNKNSVSAKSSQEPLLTLNRVEKRKTGLSVSNDQTAKRSRAVNII